MNAVRPYSHTPKSICGDTSRVFLGVFSYFSNLIGPENSFRRLDSTPLPHETQLRILSFPQKETLQFQFRASI